MILAHHEYLRQEVRNKPVSGRFGAGGGNPTVEEVCERFCTAKKGVRGVAATIFLKFGGIFGLELSVPPPESDRGYHSKSSIVMQYIIVFESPVPVAHYCL